MRFLGERPNGKGVNPYFGAALAVAACPSTPDASQRGFRGRLLLTFIQIRRAPAGAMSATPPVAVWITRWTTPLVVLAPSG